MLWFRRFCVYGLQHLQLVDIHFKGELERVDIEAPNICHLVLADLEGRGVPSMNVASCKKLTTLCYVGDTSPTSDDVTDLLSNFPFIEDLFLRLPDECKRLNLSSHSLRTFMLDSKCGLDKIDVDTPNLQLFGFTDDSCNYTRMKTNPTPSKACIKWDRDVCIRVLYYIIVWDYVQENSIFGQENSIQRVEVAY